MVRVAEGIEQRGGSLRLIIYHKGQRITETSQGACDAAHIRRVAKRREWLLSRLRIGLPIYEDDARLLGQIADDYFDTLTVKRSTLRSYENIWKIYWAQWSNINPPSITPAMIKKVLAQSNVSAKTRRNALAVLSSVMKHGEVNPNPCATITIKRDQKKEVVRYLPTEVDALLSKLDGQERVYFTLLAATGLRPGEALALRWEDYDGTNVTISKQIVRRRLTRTTKTGVRRKVLVPTWARDTINQHTTRFAGGYIFQNTLGSHHCDTDLFNNAWRKAHEKARIPYRIPYTLRHTRAAELLSRGCSEARAAKQLGHSIQMFLNTYSELIDEYSDEDLSVLEGTRHQMGTKGDVSA